MLCPSWLSLWAALPGDVELPAVPVPIHLKGSGSAVTGAVAWAWVQLLRAPSPLPNPRLPHSWLQGALDTLPGPASPDST